MGAVGELHTHTFTRTRTSRSLSCAHHSHLYYFMELGRKILDTVVITHAKKGVQTGLASAIQWIFNFYFMFAMPCACASRSSYALVMTLLGCVHRCRHEEQYK